MANPSRFTDTYIQGLFGHEAAEDERPERLREYYLKSSVFEQVTADLPLRILVGHKGIGKSALFSVAMAEDKDNGNLSILIQPNDIANLARNTNDLFHAINDWSNGIADIITEKSLASFGIANEGLMSKAKSYGGLVLDFLTDTLNIEQVNLNPTRERFKEQFLRNHKVVVYIDDLDRGWEGRKEDVTRISALLNAVRDISNKNRGINFKISLRSDVYFLYRTSDESTDKVEGSVVWHTWTNHEIFVLLIKRMETFDGREVDELALLRTPQSQLSRYLTPTLEERFSGRGHWQNAPMYRVLMSLIRRRPRDLVKLCTLAARKAYQGQSNIIRAGHLEASFEEYSLGRIQDTINEYRSELSDISRLLFGMKPQDKRRIAKDSYVYDTDELIKKINGITGRGGIRFANGKVATSRELAAFLYKINFITARREMPEGIIRKYFEENRYLFPDMPNSADFGFEWEVHPAYRWALQPSTPEDIFTTLKLSVDS